MLAGALTLVSDTSSQQLTAGSVHLITGEFPPAPGGVSDYSLQIAAGLARTGAAVHVWCPDAPGARLDPPGVAVHRVAGGWHRHDLARLDRQLDAAPEPRRLLVQWVPHEFGRRSLNVDFCRWVQRLARAGDVVELMVHEPFLAFGEGGLRQQAAAAVHRLMAVLLLSAARRAWVSIPAWEQALRPWAYRRDLPFRWLPVPSGIPVARDDEAVRSVKRALAGGGPVFGHFGTYGRDACAALTQIVPVLLTRAPGSTVLLLGRSGDRFAERLRERLGPQAAGVHAPGPLDPRRLSIHLQACSVLVQPYPDGVTTRRTTLMAALEHGVPVATTWGRLSEAFWRESEAITAVPAGDHQGLADAALALAGDGDRAARQAAAGRRLYDDRFHVRHSIEALRSALCSPA